MTQATHRHHTMASSFLPLSPLSPLSPVIHCVSAVYLIPLSSVIHSLRFACSDIFCASVLTCRHGGLFPFIQGIFNIESALDSQRLVEGLSGVVYRPFCVVVIPTCQRNCRYGGVVVSYGICLLCLKMLVDVVAGTFVVLFSFFLPDLSL